MSAEAIRAGLALFVLRATLVLGVALVVDYATRKAPAIHRHRLWTLTFSAILLLTVLPAVLPDLPVRGPLFDTLALEVRPTGEAVRPTTPPPDLGEPRESAQELFDAHGEIPVLGPSPGARNTRDAGFGDDRLATAGGWLARARRALAAWLVPLWLFGATAGAVSLLVSQIRAHGLLSDSRDLTLPGWLMLADELRRRLGLRRRVHLRSTVRVRTPMAGGLWRAMVLLPISAESWSASRRSVVLSHELVHHAHRDPLRHLVARAALALLWFHPLAWLAGRQALLAREQACDERVLRLGARPSEYARHLLELAESLTPSPSLPAAALPMIQRSLLEKRLMSILTERRTRFAVPIALIGGVALVLTTLTAAAAAPATRPGSPAAAQVVPENAGLASLNAELGALSSGIASLSAATPPLGLQSGPPLSACDWPDERRRFSGSMSIHSEADEEQRYERHGWGDGWRVLQTNLEGMRLCLQSASDDRYSDRSWSDVAESGERLMLEIRDDRRVQAMEIEDGAIVSWSVDGRERPADEAARRWREQTLLVADGLWEAGQIRGQLSSLRGQISSIRGQRSSLRGRISSLRGQVSSMRGSISSARGRESSLRGRISSLRGHVSSLRGGISSERGQISGVRSALRYVSDEERERLEEKIEASERRIRELEQEIEEFDLDAKVAEVERDLSRLDTDGEVARIEQQIAEFDLDAKVAEVEAELANLDVEGKVEEIERRIEDLDAESRIASIEARLEQQVRELVRIVDSSR